MNHIFSCECGEILIKAVGDLVKVRSKILLFKAGQCFIVCKKCSTEHLAPISLGDLSKARNPPLLFVDSK